MSSTGEILLRATISARRHAGIQCNASGMRSSPWTGLGRVDDTDQRATEVRSVARPFDEAVGGVVVALDGARDRRVAHAGPVPDLPFPVDALQPVHETTHELVHARRRAVLSGQAHEGEEGG